MVVKTKKSQMCGIGCMTAICLLYRISIVFVVAYLIELQNNITKFQVLNSLTIEVILDYLITEQSVA